jgi:hypothetical protein
MMGSDPKAGREQPDNGLVVNSIQFGGRAVVDCPVLHQKPKPLNHHPA